MYRKAEKGWLKHFDFLMVDVLCLQVALCLGNQLSGRKAVGMTYIILMVNLLLVQLVVILFREPYKGILKRGYYREFVETWKQMFWVVMITRVYMLGVQGLSVHPFWTVLMIWVFSSMFGYLARLLRKRYLQTHGIHGQEKQSLLIVTESTMSDDIMKKLVGWGYSNYGKIQFAFLDQDLTGQTIGSVPVVAGSETVEEYVCREWVDEVFVIMPPEKELPRKMLDNFTRMGVTLHLNLASFYSSAGKKQQVERMGEYTVLTTSINVINAKNLFIKRTIDLAGGLVGCLAALVLTVIVGPMIYIQSPGNIFFSQIRVGKNGKKFRMYKFRSMYLDAEERKQELMSQNRVQDGLMFKMADDPRIIGGKHGIGSIIRRYSLDEFPQFWNVLKGDMSLVGTRPPTVDEWEKYDLHHRTRLAIRPGITGMWQVSGRSDVTNFEEVVQLDQEYIENWSVGLDVRILLKTVGAVFGRNGAM